ncbi:MAG: glycosyltransferase family 39 protein [Candidatus Doudnabacteria bacterium]|nr:glycosyltransferase family 39 protein [Candidatus Doudnabacteria bacterium]
MNFLKKHWALVTILLIAAFFRLWQINSLPGGLFPDEAANGLDINSIFNGDIQPFYERGNGREALFFYVIALVVSIFGRGAWQHHIVSGGFGIAEVFTTYLLTKRLFGKRVALLSSFLMAVSSYAVTMNRTAFRANTIPLFTTLTLYFLVKFFQVEDRRAKLWSAFWAGISFGLGFYTYISYRMMIPLLIIFGALIFFAYRDNFKTIVRDYIKPKLIFLLGFLISFGWIGYYFLTHPGSFVGRAGQVSIFSPALNHGDVVGTFLGVFKLTMLSFFTNGDLNWRHNISGYAFLSPFISPFFAIGLLVFTWSILVLLKQVWQKNLKFDTVARSLTAVLFWFMLAPEVTTAEGIPHGLRLIGVIPSIFIMSAYGMNAVWNKISKYLNLNFSRYAIPTIMLLGIFVYNFYLYFAVAAGSPDYYYAFRSDLNTASQYLNERHNKEKTYLSLDKFSVQTVDYLTTETGQPYTLLDPANTYKVTLEQDDQVIFTMSTLFDITAFVQAHPDARLVKEIKNKFNHTIMRVYQKP